MEALSPSVVVGCHTPAITGRRVAAALDVTRGTPSLTLPAQPDRAVLEGIEGTLDGIAA